MGTGFKSLLELVNYCKFCSVCQQECELIIELAELSTLLWFDTFGHEINEDNLKIFGLLFVSNELNEEDFSRSIKSDYVVNLPLNDKAQVSVFPDYFPETFEFYMQSSCNSCGKRDITTENIKVSGDIIGPKFIENELIKTKKYFISLNSRDDIMEIFIDKNEFNSNNLLIEIDFASIKVDLSNLDDLDNKISKYLLLI